MTTTHQYTKALKKFPEKIVKTHSLDISIKITRFRNERAWYGYSAYDGECDVVISGKIKSNLGAWILAEYFRPKLIRAFIRRDREVNNIIRGELALLGLPWKSKAFIKKITFE